MVLITEFYKSKTRANKYGNVCQGCRKRIDKSEICMRAVHNVDQATQYTIYHLMHMRCWRIGLQDGVAKIKKEKELAMKIKKDRIVYLNAELKKLRKMTKMKYHSTMGYWCN